MRKPVELLWLAIFLISIVVGGCAEKPEKLFVYSGKALKKPMEDIRGAFVDNHQYVALHVPVIAVHKDNPKNIHTFNDLAIPAVRLAIGNAKMCSMGKVADTILKKTDLKDQLTKNVVIKTSTGVEIADLLLQKEIHAGIVWQDLLARAEYQDLRCIEIPSALNAIQEIHIAILMISQDNDIAQLFADFTASEGRAIFKKHGFGEK